MDVITFPENRLTTSGLQILLHGIISLPDATSYDKDVYIPTKVAICTLYSCDKRPMKLIL